MCNSSPDDSPSFSVNTTSTREFSLLTQGLSTEDAEHLAAEISTTLDYLRLTGASD
ncbi:hypothetical protein [Pseudomonas sp. MYb330]|uniref:hypothetical protein n=1 Tax=unclassified Pseudomonas TaxID=196821 RepID=UPI00403F58B6